MVSRTLVPREPLRSVSIDTDPISWVLERLSTVLPSSVSLSEIMSRPVFSSDIEVSATSLLMPALSLRFPRLLEPLCAMLSMLGNRS